MNSDRQKTVTTSLPLKLASEVERAAARELLSVASFVRRALLAAVQGQTGAAVDERTRL